MDLINFYLNLQFLLEISISSEINVQTIFCKQKITKMLDRKGVYSKVSSDWNYNVIISYSNYLLFLLFMSGGRRRSTFALFCWLVAGVPLNICFGMVNRVSKSTTIKYISQHILRNQMTYFQKNGWSVQTSNMPHRGQGVPVRNSFQDNRGSHT